MPVTNQFQIKRSNTSSTPATTLKDGELAYSYLSNTFFIGAQSGVGATALKVGGAKYSYLDSATPGSLLPLTVAISDANSFVSADYISSLVIQPSSLTITSPTITAINATATASLLGLASNNELTTTWAIKTYVDSKVAAGGGAQLTGAAFTGNVSVTAANLYVATTNTTFTSNVTFTGANIDATTSTLNLRDLVLSGNLTITGTTTTVDTATLAVKDNNIKIADQNLTSDLLDSGIYTTQGNTTVTYYSGLYRDRAASTLTNPVFKLFSSNTEPTTIVDNTQPTYVLGTLNAYLTSGAFVSNTTVVNITATPTLSSTINANTITSSNPIPATSGGTGINTYTIGDIFVASSTTTLSRLPSGTTGQVLVAQGAGVLSWQALDSGTF